MSPISSRNSVPPSASSKRPLRALIAPVKAPFSWPNSSLSSRSAGIAPQLIGMNGPSRRGEDRAGDDFLAGARLAEDQHVRVECGDLLHEAADAAHGQRIPRGLGFFGALQVPGSHCRPSLAPGASAW
jgi:hypothetical protein